MRVALREWESPCVCEAVHRHLPHWPWVVPPCAIFKPVVDPFQKRLRPFTCKCAPERHVLFRQIEHSRGSIDVAGIRILSVRVP